MKGKAKKGAWFYKIRGSYLPCSWQGLTIYFVYMAYVIALPVAWYLGERNLWSLVTFVVPLWVAAAVFTQYVASRHAK